MSARTMAGARRPRLRIAMLGWAAAVSLTAAAPALAQEAPAPVAAPAAVSTASAPLDERGYWALADAMQARLDEFWSKDSDTYRVGGGGADPSVNGQLLLVHAVAAMRGHEGPARNDARARLIARRLVASTPFVDGPGGGGSQAHHPGWSSSLDDPKGDQHLVFDAQVVDGLVYAWRAREALDLPESTVRLIVDRLHRAANGPFYRWPALRLNQVNWYGLMYEAAATVAGDRNLLRRDLRLQLERFVSGIGPHGRAAGNLGPGGRFHYLPDKPVNHPMNVDSAEYANIVMSVTRFLDHGREAGMRLSPHTRSTMRAWATRVLAGYWTHAGYLNWDTGLGFDRWHQAKKLGLVQEALIGLAQDDTLGLDAKTKHWAKAMLDRGLQLYERTAQREGGIPAGVFFGVHVVPQGPSSARLAASRMEANAARAIAAGLGEAASSTPPPLFAYDPDTGRLAVTTPSYNTAVVPVNQRAFPYGGVELARLFDGDQGVAGTIGGTAPAGFGLVVRDTAGARVLASQTGRALRAGSPPVRLLRAPNLARATAARRAGRVFAGPFADLKATGTTNASGIAARTTHTFTARTITTSWSLRRHGSRGLTASAMLPSHGRRARIDLVLRDGRTVRLGRTPVSAARVRSIAVRSDDSGYEVDLLRAPRGATLSAVTVGAQSSAPRPGPSLAVRLATGTTWRTAALTVRLTVRPALAAAR
jgi:hypothetical protein